MNDQEFYNRILKMFGAKNIDYKLLDEVHRRVLLK